MTVYLPGWPCAPAATNAPSIADKLSSPTGDDLLPQVLALTPRGPAWGTDEAGDGSGASPVMRLVWKALAFWSSASYRADFDLATQALPSAITYSLREWEAEYGLPDPCVGDPGNEAARRSAVRARYAALGGQSPAYFICLGESLGYDVCLIEELYSFRAGDPAGSRCSGDGWDFAWMVHASPVTVTYFTAGSLAGEPLASWGNAVLECAINRAKPAHTTVIFAYDCP